MKKFSKEFLLSDLFENFKKKLPVKFSDGIDCKSIWNEELNGYEIYIPHGYLFFSENFFPKKISDRSVEYFQENDHLIQKNWKNLSKEQFNKIKFKNVKWKQDNVNFYGKNIDLPRLTSWYGDSGKLYTYSGIKSYPNEWNDALIYIKEKIENVSQCKFNSVLLNWYRDGEDYLNWHSDDEKELGRNPVISSVNFGETRDFLLRQKNEHSKKISIPLAHGTLLIMKGELQHFWQHAVPKRKSVIGSRFNLTFRQIKN